MSRSYKKTPILKDSNKSMKKFANKRVRKRKNFSVNGKAYRKIFNSYDICDWVFRVTKEDEKRDLIGNVKSILNHEKSYNYYLRRVEYMLELSEINLEDITCECIDKKINYHHWRKYHYSK